VSANAFDVRGLIRRIRKRLGDKQTEFAVRLGYERSTIQYWENGKRRPSPEALLEVRKYATPDEAKEIDAAIAAFEYHLGDGRKELRAQLHIALDVILDCAPQTVVDDLGDRLTGTAGKYGDSGRRPSGSPSPRKPFPRRPMNSRL
jgi:transcriptional regulator with XRE-family HTH domain